MTALFSGGMRIVTMMVRPHVQSFLEEMLRSEHKVRTEAWPYPGRHGHASRP